MLGNKFKKSFGFSKGSKNNYVLKKETFHIKDP